MRELSEIKKWKFRKWTTMWLQEVKRNKESNESLENGDDWDYMENWDLKNTKTTTVE